LDILEAVVKADSANEERVAVDLVCEMDGHWA
jgi:hypothetical protein